MVRSQFKQWNVTCSRVLCAVVVFWWMLEVPNFISEMNTWDDHQ